MTLNTKIFGAVSAAFLAVGSTAMANDHPYKRMPVTNLLDQMPKGFAPFAAEFTKAVQRQDADTLQGLVSASYRCINWNDKDCRSGNLAHDLMGNYGDWNSVAATWGTLVLTRGEASGEYCAPGELEYDDDLLYAAHDKIGDMVVEPFLEWLAVVGEAKVYGSPQAHVAISTLKNELVYPTFYLAFYDSEGNENVDLESKLQLRARQQVLMPDGRRGFVHSDKLSPIYGDQICFSQEGGIWRVKSLHRAYYP